MESFGNKITNPVLGKSMTIEMAKDIVQQFLQYSEILTVDQMGQTREYLNKTYGPEFQIIYFYPKESFSYYFISTYQDEMSLTFQTNNMCYLVFQTQGERELAIKEFKDNQSVNPEENKQFEQKYSIKILSREQGLDDNTVDVILAILIVAAIAVPLREYYKVLDIKQTASQQDIKRAYRKLTRIYHPDHYKGKDANEKMSKINVAYEVLSDPEKRRKYDAHGEEGLKPQAQQQHNPFASFFGQQEQGEQKGPEMLVKIQVSLEDIYIGREVPVYLTKRTICPNCRGSGADDPEFIKECPVCKGKGHVLRQQQMGFFIQQVQVPCDSCGGKGKFIKKKCSVCKGNRIINGQEEITLFIEKGINDGHTMKYEGSGDDHADMASSDIVFKIITLQHDVFERKGNDLYTKIQITLEEALLGFKKKLKHLDEHYVKIDRNGVTQPGEMQMFEGEGMPHHEFSSNYGNLYIQFIVDFPKSFTDEQMQLWKQFFKV